MPKDKNGPKRRWRPLPKTPEGKIDLDKVKQQFMDAKAMNSRDFSAELNYRRDNFVDHCPIKKWREEKLAKLIQEADETTQDRAISIRAETLTAQLKTIEEVPATLFRALNVYKYAIRDAEERIADDIRDKMSGLSRDPKWKPKFKMSQEDVAALMRAGESIQKSLYNAVGLAVRSDRTPAVQVLIDQAENVAKSREQTTQGQKLVPIKNMGMVDRATLSDMMSKWFDAPQAPQPAPEQAQAEEQITAPVLPSEIVLDEGED